MNREELDAVDADVKHIEAMRTSGLDTAQFSSQKYLDEVLSQRISATLIEVRAKDKAGRVLYRALLRWEKTKSKIRNFFSPVTALFVEFKSLWDWAKGRIKHENAKRL